MMLAADPYPLRTVRLYGHLAHEIGREIELAFDSPVRALRLIELNFPGFLDRFKKGKFHVSIRRGKEERDLTEEELSQGFTGEELHIMPRATGRGKGKSLLTAIVGGLIIGAAYFFSGGVASMALPGLFGATGATFGTLSTMGMGLVLTGIGGLITKTPKTNYNEDKLESFIFNGPVNTNEQGGAMPLVFGRMMTGSIVLSASLDVEDSSEDVTSGMEQAATNVTVSIRDTDQGEVSVNMGNLVRVTQGATLTGLNGQPISGSGSFVIGGDLHVRYNSAGEYPSDYQNRTPFHMLRTPRAVVFFDWQGIRPPAREVIVPFEVTHNQRQYTANIIVKLGDPQRRLNPFRF